MSTEDLLAPDRPRIFDVDEFISNSVPDTDNYEDTEEEEAAELVVRELDFSAAEYIDWSDVDSSGMFDE